MADASTSAGSKTATANADLATTKEKKKAGKLGIVGLTALIISAMVGSGVFDLPKNMAQVAGLEAQIIAWIVVGIGMWFIAEMFIVLSDLRPDLTAGLYKYAEVGFGRFTGFFTAWGYFICECFANVAYAVLVMATLNYFWPGVFTGGNNWWSVLGASIITWAITGLVLLGVEVSNTIQKIATATILSVITVFIVVVLMHFNGHTFVANAPAVNPVPALHDTSLGNVPTQFMNTMMVILWLFGGIEGAVVMSGVARKPEQVPKATAISFFICTAMFAAISILSLGVFTYGELNQMQSPSMAAMLNEMWHSSAGSWVITIALLIAVFSSWISWIQMLAELPQHGAKEDGTFPKLFAKVNKKGIPVNSVIIATFIIEIFIFYAHFSQNAYQFLLTITGTMTVAPYMISALFLIKISAVKDLFPTGTKHKRIPSLIVGILAFITTAVMAVAAGISYVAISFVIYALGIPLYVWARLEHKEDKEPMFTKGEIIFAVLIVVVAIIGVILEVKGVQLTF